MLNIYLQVAAYTGIIIVKSSNITLLTKTESNINFCLQI